MDTPLSHWLRLLWHMTPPLRASGDAPYIAGGAIHLPAHGHWQQHCAAAAHAMAHFVYSPPRFDGRGLAPIARALMALLEDARVEALASRELPGLARLWRPLHVALPADGAGFEALMQRLARALADPAYDDPHPWVNKGRELFYLDPRLALPALRTPAELRRAAQRLGHDIGQMRLAFNPRTYRPAPAYRDDHRWMWAADDLATVEPPRPSPDAAGAADEAGDILPAAGETVAHYPEWDRLIARLRPDWCSVIERPDPAPPAAPPRPLDAAMHRLSRRMRAALGALNRQAGALRRSRDGEVFDVDALVHWRIATRLGRAADTRIYRARQPRAARAAVCLLVDQSASTAAPHGASARSVLQAAAQSAAATALALQANGIDCAVAGFSSNGRHAVRLHSIKRLGPASTALLAARLQALRSGGSTRLGAALRHAAACLGGVRSGPRWVLVLSDGQPHDIDVHDPRYLVEDARHAVRDAARRSVRMVCLTLAADAQGAADARCIFGHGATLALKDIDSLPRAVQRLLG